MLTFNFAFAITILVPDLTLSVSFSKYVLQVIIDKVVIHARRENLGRNEALLFKDYKVLVNPR